MTTADVIRNSGMTCARADRGEVEEVLRRDDCELTSRFPANCQVQHTDTIPGEENSMANLAGVVQQLQTERDQAAQTVERLDAALAALNGDSYGSHGWK